MHTNSAVASIAVYSIRVVNARSVFQEHHLVVVKKEEHEEECVALFCP